jgi:3alpha(or 20beta)-hydroxysteroid dehydrogenase
MFSLDGKVAIVTGAASGIGLATTRRFAAAGATVVLADITDAAATAAELHGHYFRADVSDEEQVKALMTSAASIKGTIDICINNVGVGTGNLLVDTATSDMTQAFMVNTLGAFFGMKNVVEYMPPGSAIVNTSSIAGVIGYPTYGAYGASKFAIVGLTKIAALEFGGRGIRVNCICPSSVDTPQLAADPNGHVEVAALGSAAAVHRLIQPEDVAAAMHFLVSDDCPVISGQALVLDGGATAGISPTFIEIAVAASSSMTTNKRE